MTDLSLPDAMVERSGGGGSILLVVLDGLGGLPHPDTGLTELESARTPHLDRIAARSSLGMLTPVQAGIAPGSGPGHLALFGYDPVRYLIGRGVLSALGIGFDLRPGDVAARVNLATLDGDGIVMDRRAGRPPDEEGRRVVQRVKEAIEAPDGVEIFLRHVKEHRAVLVLRGQGLGAELGDTDPQETGVPPEPVRASDEASAKTAEILEGLLERVREVLSGEEAITGFLLRGFAAYEKYPSFEERFGLRAAAFAKYPMYRGVARLVGMDIPGVPESDEEAVSLLEEHFAHHDFGFLHFKTPDARGEDRDFPAKVRAIEEADAFLPRLEALEPDVLVVTGDHSTPATFGAHSWHSVPVVLASRWARPTADAFGESACRGGDLGTIPARHLMSLALAHAGRLEKFGA